jgi:hypothetical protein
MNYNIRKAGKNELTAQIQTQQEVQRLMTVVLEHLNNSNKTDAEKLASINSFANGWYDMATIQINDCIKEITRRKEEA